MDWDDQEIKGKVLHKLTRKGKFEHSHTAIENLQSGFPRHMGGKVKEAISGLKKEGILIAKRTSYGEHVPLNLEKMDRIMEYIDSFLKT